MGFLGGLLEATGNILGDALGKLAAEGETIQKYKNEYELLGDSDLVREFNRLKKKYKSNNYNDEYNDEYKFRLMAVRGILNDRGLLKEER